MLLTANSRRSPRRFAVNARHDPREVAQLTHTRRPVMMRVSILLAAATFAANITACDDTPTAAMETPADDSALALSVMTARGDTLTAAVEVVREEEPLTPPVVATTPAPVRIQPAPQTRAPTPTPVAPAPIASPTPEPTIAVANVEPTRAATPRREREVEREPARRETPKRTGTISSGSALSLVTTEKACAEGETFRVVLANSVRGSNGAVIPDGASAVAEITSVDKWGAGIGVRVRSVRIDGKSYPLNSRVTYVLPESGGCIAGRTRIEVETKGSVTVAAQ